MAVRIGVIGLGGVAALHLQAYRQVEEVEIIAAAEIDEARLAEASTRFGFKPYPDYRQMLEAEALDGVCVLTPASTHEAIVCDAARAGLHVLCEKPLSTSSASCLRMIDACVQHGVRLFYGASYRFLAAIRAARSLIASGVLGDIYVLREQVIGGRGAGHRRPLSFAHYPRGGMGGSGLGLVDHGVHLIDAFAWMMGNTAVSAFGRGTISGDPACTEFAMLQYPNGSVGNLLYEDRTFAGELPGEGHFSAGEGWDADGAVAAGSWSSTPGSIYVHGSKGALRILHYANALYLRSEGGVRQIPLPVEAPPAQFAAQLRCFVASLDPASAVEPAIAGDAAPSGEDGLRAVATLEAIYKSAKSGHLEPIESR